LGCMGPNKTITTPDGTVYPVPCDIRYYNILNGSTSEEVVYLSVTNSTPYFPGDVMMNGVSHEPPGAVEKRLQDEKATNKNPRPIEGAYGIINMQSGTSTDIKFTTLNYRGKETVLDQVIAMTFLDLDQTQNAKVTKLMSAEQVHGVGGEEVDVCTGPKSYGMSPDTTLNHSYKWRKDGVELCHTVSSANRGDPEDNPWDPARTDAGSGEVAGLSRAQREKSFIAAFYGQSTFTATFRVNEMEKHPRNIQFVSHATSFCDEEFALGVKDDAAKMKSAR